MSFPQRGARGAEVAERANGAICAARRVRRVRPGALDASNRRTCARGTKVAGRAILARDLAPLVRVLAWRTELAEFGADVGRDRPELASAAASTRVRLTGRTERLHRTLTGHVAGDVLQGRVVAQHGDVLARERRVLGQRCRCA